jgi:hypothetical protein
VIFAIRLWVEQRVTFFGTYPGFEGDQHFEGAQGRENERLDHVIKKRRRSKTLAGAGFEGDQGAHRSLP